MKLLALRIRMEYALIRRRMVRRAEQKRAKFWRKEATRKRRDPLRQA